MLAQHTEDLLLTTGTTEMRRGRGKGRRRAGKGTETQRETDSQSSVARANRPGLFWKMKLML